MWFLNKRFKCVKRTGEDIESICQVGRNSYRGGHEIRGIKGNGGNLEMHSFGWLSRTILLY